SLAAGFGSTAMATSAAAASGGGSIKVAGTLLTIVSLPATAGTLTAVIASALVAAGSRLAGVASTPATATLRGAAGGLPWRDAWLPNNASASSSLERVDGTCAFGDSGSATWLRSSPIEFRCQIDRPVAKQAVRTAVATVTLTASCQMPRSLFATLPL